MGFTQRNKHNLVADINVTPLVDVMLVLLIIFMVTAPMMTQGVDVELPETTSATLRQDEDPIVITINKQGEIFLNRVKCDSSLLKQQLSVITETDKQRSVYLKADKEVAYGLVASVMADIKDVGLNKLGMVTSPDESR